MDTADFERSELERTNDVLKLEDDAPPTRRRMPSGTEPPFAADAELDGHGLPAAGSDAEWQSAGIDTLLALAQRYETEEAWNKLAPTIRRIIDLGELQDTFDEQEAIELYAQLARIEGDLLGRFDEAIAAWTKLIAIDPSDLRALVALENLFTYQERWDELVDVLEKRALVVDADDERAAALVQAAAICEDQLEDTARAAALYERVRSADPAHDVAYARLAAIHRDQRSWTELVELMLERSELVADADEQRELLHAIAKLYERELADAESAFYVLQAAHARDPQHAHTGAELERLAGIAQRWQELLDDYTKRVEELERTDRRAAAELWVKIGRLYQTQLSHRDYALHSMQQALRLEPSHAGALVEVASLQHRGDHGDGDVDAEIRAWTDVLVHEPAHAGALAALDRLYRRTQAWAPLVDVLARRAKLAADDEDAAQLHLEIGAIAADQLADSPQAITAYQRALDIEPGNRDALRALEALYAKTGQHAKTIAVLETQLDAAHSDDERVEIYERIAGVWEDRLGKLDRAAEAYEQIIAIAPDHVASYRLLERLYPQLGQYDALAATLAKHIAATREIAPRVELYVAMGDTYATRLHQSDRALAAYEAALALDADETHALEAAARLYEQRGDHDRAVAMLARLIEAGDEARMHELYARMGRLQYHELGDATAAETSLQRSLALVPEHLPAMEALIEQYTDRGEWAKAAQMMVRAEAHAKLVTDKVRLLADAANIHMYKLGGADRAKPLYAAVLAHDPEHVDAARPLAELYFKAEQWAELAPVIEMLCRKADRRREPSELHALHYRAARCAEQLGELDKALGFYTSARDLDATHMPTLLGRADLLFKQQDWDNAGRSYQTILAQRGDDRDADTVRIYQRLGVIRRALGQPKKALAMFDKALELDPLHRDTLEAIVELQTQAANWDAVVRAKRALATTASAREQAKLLDDIAGLYRSKLQNPAKAADALREALDHAADDRALLQKLLDLYIETRQWPHAIATIEKFLALETDAYRKGVYLHAAAAIHRDELQATDDAVSCYGRALDCFFAQPQQLDDEALKRALMSFEAIDRLLTAKRDWKAQERAYRDMIKRLPQDGNPRFRSLQVGLLDSLGEIYRSRLKQYRDAAGVFEVAQQLDPTNALRAAGADRAEILAELYVVAGLDLADKAVAQHALMLQREPFKYDSYSALARIYRETQQHDKYWCLCNALAFLHKAAPDEQAFYEQYRPRGLVKAKRAMTNDSWSKLASADENRYISAIFAACWQGVAAMKAFPHKDFGVKREDRRQLDGDQLLFSKLVLYAAQVLNVPVPDIYLLSDHKPMDIQLANATEKGELCPSFLVRPHVLQGKTEREVAFIAARRLAFMRPEYYLRMLLPTHTELKVALLSAIAMLQPRFTIPANLVATVQQYVPSMQKHMPAHALEQLGAVVQRFIQATPEIDVAKWGHAVDAAANRAGFVTCGDLPLAARTLAAEAAAVGGPTVKDRIKDLVLFSISDDYFAVRAQLGISLA